MITFFLTVIVMAILGAVLEQICYKIEQSKQ